ncbi:hypothetical protein M2303_002194 [Micromonospora sp. H404/HB375]|nr:hypothetical protein [Micromonospora sp. H404/HB375]
MTSPTRRVGSMTSAWNSRRVSLTVIGIKAVRAGGAGRCYGGEERVCGDDEGGPAVPGSPAAGWQTCRAPEIFRDGRNLASMDVNGMLTEFVVPGAILTGSVALLVNDTGLGHEALQGGAAVLGGAGTVVGLACTSYVAGVLCSELGTALVKRQGERVSAKCIRTMEFELSDTEWAKLRNPRRRVGWSDFSYMRAACRRADGAAKRIGSHENVLRILRPSLAALPISTLSIAIFIWRNSHIPLWIGLLFAVVGPVLAYISTVLAFRQRLRTTVRSAIDHYVALQKEVANE